VRIALTLKMPNLAALDKHPLSPTVQHFGNLCCPRNADYTGTRVADEPLITLFSRPGTPNRANAEHASSATQLRSFSRFLGRVLVCLSILCFTSSGYLGFVHYWLLTHWTKAEAIVLSGEIRQHSFASSGTGSGLGRSSTSFFFHCTVSYAVGGKALQSQLDSPTSPYRIDAQASLSPGQSVDILYESDNPSHIRLANNPAEITVTGSVKAALLFLVPGLLLAFASRPRNSQ